MRATRTFVGVAAIVIGAGVSVTGRQTTGATPPVVG
jgi:hypothetical protein